MKETPPNFRDGINAYMRGEFARAAEIFARGHKQCEPECTAQLAICYSEGAGVPRDLNVYYQLTRELKQRNCPLAYCLLASAYSDGLGCKVDMQKAMEYVKRWAKESSKPLAGISEECRLYMRHNGLSSALEQSLQYYEANTGEPPFIDHKSATREYAQHTTLADKPMAELLVLLDETPQGAPTPQAAIELLEQAIQENLDGAACMLGKTLLENCSENDTDTRNRALALIAEEKNGCDSVETLFIKAAYLPAPEDSVEDERLLLRLHRCMQYGPSGLPRADELPCRLEPTASPYSGVYYVHDIETTQHYADNNESHKLFRELALPDITITNTGTEVLADLNLRIVLEGMSGECTVPLGKTLHPGEQHTICLNNVAEYRGNSIRLELHATDGRYVSVLYNKFYLDHISPQIPQMELLRNDDSLIIWPRWQNIKNVQILTPDNEKIAELHNLTKDEPVSTDLWHLKASLVKARSNVFLVICDDCKPALAFIK